MAATEQAALETGRRVVARRRAVATAIAWMFFRLGWAAAWASPPVVVLLGRKVRAGLGWCRSAMAVGWAEARAAAAAASDGAGGRG